jgi:hypothetical protein
LKRGAWGRLRAPVIFVMLSGALIGPVSAVAAPRLHATFVANRIVLTSSESGLCEGSCNQRESVLCRHTSVYWTCAGSDTYYVADSDIRELVRAALTPAPEFSLDAAGFTRNRIRSIQHAATRTLAENFPDLKRRQRKRALALVWNSAYVRQYLAQCYTVPNSAIVELSIGLSLDITGTDGRRLTITNTTIRHRFLPWNVSIEGVESTSYNARISQSVLALLPKDNAARDYLAYTDEYFGSSVADQADEDAVNAPDYLDCPF